MRRLVALGALVGTALAGCGQAPDAVTVFAAASLRDACAQLGADYEARTGEPVEFSFAGSNLLARQIVAARGADAFLSADEHQLDVVEAAGLVADGTRRRLLTNRLVVVVPTGSALELADADDLRGVARLSLANPELVPAGRYARAWLEEREVWDAVADRVLPALDVRAALGAVEVGAADAGICYATDAARSRRARVAHEVPAGEGPEITYAVCALEDSAAGRAFVEFLTTPAARAVFAEQGFGVLEEDGR